METAIIRSNGAPYSAEIRCTEKHLKKKKRSNAVSIWQRKDVATATCHRVSNLAAWARVIAFTAERPFMNYVWE